MATGGDDMDSSLTRRQTLQAGGLALAGGLAGCLGDDEPSGETLAVDGMGSINETTLPSRQQYRTPDATFPKYRRYDAGDAKTVLLLHHTAGFDSRMLQPLSTALAETGVAHVITPDLRGHGPDPERRGDIDYIGQYQDDIEHLVNSIELVYPDARVVIGGHGAGGGIAVRFGSKPIGSIADGYLLLAPYLGFDAPTTQDALGGWATFYMDRIIMLRIFTGFGSEKRNDMTTVEFEIPDSVLDGTETLENSYRLMKSYTPAEEDVGSMADVPSLTVAGTDDETAHADAYEPLFADRIDADVKLIDGASHLDLVLSEVAVDPIVDWLKNLK